MSGNEFAQRRRIVSNLYNVTRQAQYRAAGFAYAGKVQKGQLIHGKIWDGSPTQHDACASVASQVVKDVGLLTHSIAKAEALDDALKATRVFDGFAVHDAAGHVQAQAGDLVVCLDGNHNGESDHVWWIVRDLGNGWYTCLDNQGASPTYARRLDGHDGRTPARGLLRCME